MLKLSGIQSVVTHTENGLEISHLGIKVLRISVNYTDSYPKGSQSVSKRSFGWRGRQSARFGSCGRFREKMKPYIAKIF